MTDKEFRRLSRPELIDIIFELQLQLKQRKGEIQRLTQAVQKRELDISNAGSLAEAVVSINGVMEAAQAAADQYILSAKAANEKAEQTLVEAKAEAVRIVCDAQEKAKQIEASTMKSTSLIWDDFQSKVTEMLEAHKELSISAEEVD